MTNGAVQTKRGPGTTLVELHAGAATPVSGLEILDLRMWFSGVQIPCGGISAVYCNEKYRSRGYARDCMEFAVDLQHREGKLLSFLFGIPDFYERFGYTVVMPWYGIYVSAETGGTLPSEPEMRDADVQDRSSAARFYDQLAAARVGPVVRDANNPIQPQKTVKWRSHGLMRVLSSKQGKLRGYVWHSEPQEDEFEVVEVGAIDDEAHDQILAYLLRETRRRGKQHFVVALPPDDPFALFLKSYGARFVVMTRPSGGGMARILRFHEFCDALRPCFRRRLQLLREDLVPRRLALSVEESEGIIELEGSAPEARVTASWTMMTKLLFGYWNYADALRNRISSTLSFEVGEELFPSTYPFMYLRDRF